MMMVIVQAIWGDRLAVHVSLDGVENVKRALNEGGWRVEIVVLHRNPSPHF